MWLFLFLIMGGCADKMSEPKHHRSASLFVISHELNSKRTSIRLKTSLPLKLLRKHLYLVKAPKRDQLLAKELKVTESFIIKRLLPDAVLLSSKKELLGELGLYWQEEDGDEARLIYIFRGKTSMKMEHDLGEEPLLIRPDRSLFTFLFEEKVSLTDDQAISLKNLEGGNAPLIKQVFVKEDQKTVMVELESSEDFTLGQSYGFYFGPSFKIAEEPSKLPPIQFLVAGSKKELKPKPLSLSASDQAVEILWQGEDLSSSELYLFDGENMKYFLPATLNSFYLSGLMAGKSYRFIFRQMLNDQSVWEATASFTTRPKEGLRIREVMISKDKKEEYIRLVNLGESDESLAGISLSIEDKGARASCALDSEHVVKSGGEVLITGLDFKNGLEQEVVRFSTVDLCGGLFGSMKVIKIHRQDGGFIDRYGGHLWPKKGGEVLRIDIKGLDEPNNYCYF